MRSNPVQASFLFSNSKIFYNLIQNSPVPTVARPIKSQYSSFIGEFDMSWRKNFTKILTYRRGGLGSCLDWLNISFRL